MLLGINLANFTPSTSRGGYTSKVLAGGSQCSMPSHHLIRGRGRLSTTETGIIPIPQTPEAELLS
jgi:hypothetical protein